MESYDLEPRYSTNEISGKCLKCLSEHELNSCLMQLLRDESINEVIQRKYEALLNFLKSPESQRLREESERYLADGKQVSVRISVDKGQPKYELIIKKRSEPIMKIAAISEDGTTLSQHFGRAPLYVVVTVENGRVVGKENRDKAGHHTFTAEQHQETAPGERHGYGAGAQSRHDAMAQSIEDCQVLLAGGMGWGAYDSFKSRGIDVIITDVFDIDKAVDLYLEGNLPNLMERLH